MAASDDNENAARSPQVRRQRRLLVIAVVAAVASTAGLIASTQVKSPAQLAADAKAPDPSVLTATVTRKVLTSTLVMRGRFTAGRQHEFTPKSVAASSFGPGGTDLVVTDVKTRAGSNVRAGKVLLEVSERPVYALPGAFPAYRDMLPGQTGKDVAQLRAGLAGLGYPSSDRPRYFGSSTEAAVKRFYQDIGYPVPLSTGTGGREETESTPENTTREAGTKTQAPPTAKPKPMVPMSEIAFLPSLPARVVKLSAHVGGRVSNGLITFSTGGLRLTAKLGPENEELVKVGMKAQVVSEVTGFNGIGIIADIGRRVNNTDDAAGETAYLPLRITRDDGWPHDLQGEDVRVTITTASTKKPVLAVPEAAISSAADGRTTVIVIAGARSRRTVEVTAGVSAGGLVQVTPRGDLKAGDQVVTGQ